MSQILIIDDDSFHRTTLQKGLQELGHDVRAAETGLVALRIMSEGLFAPSLILTGMVMPDMDGLEVIQHFRKHSPDIPVVAMDKPARDAFLPLAARLGARATLAKPVRPESLQETLEGILGAGA